MIRIDSARFTTDATKGLDAFSHLEIVFRFHLTNPTGFNLGARRPRDNPDWPEVGTFGHRNVRRLNWLGVSRCRLIKVDGLDLHVEELDAVDGTFVLDIKPRFAEFGPRGDIRQPSWTTEMLRDYFAPARPWFFRGRRRSSDFQGGMRRSSASSHAKDSIDFFACQVLTPRRSMARAPPPAISATPSSPIRSLGTGSCIRPACRDPVAGLQPADPSPLGGPIMKSGDSQIESYLDLARQQGFDAVLT